MDKKTEEFYTRLKEELSGSTTWPSEYLFKFIVPTEADKVTEIENTFNGLGAVIDTTQSKTGKYTSVSINVTMADAQSIIDKYVQLSTIEGIISL